MGWFRRMLGLEDRASIKWTGSVLSQDATAKNVWGAIPDTTAGVVVTEDTALNYSAVYRAVQLLSSIPGSLPKFVYKRTSDDGDKEADRKHPVYRLLHERPNPIHTPIQFEEIIRSQVLLWGRSMVYIERSTGGGPVALWPMATSQVARQWNGQQVEYDTRYVQDTDLFPKPPVSRPTLAASEVLDFSTPDGKSVIGRAREQIGEALAAQGFGAGFYGGGAQPYLVLKHPGTLTTGAMEKLRENWQKRHGDHKRRIGVLEEGMDVTEVGMPLRDAQFLDSRKFYVTEIARWFGVPPHKLMDLERATFSNIEEQQLEFYEGLLPWFARFVQEFHYKLFQPSERDDYLVDYLVDGLLKGNIAQRYQAYSTALQWGFMSRNEVRAKENLNNMGEEGDVFLAPVNMQPASQIDEPEGEATATGTGPEDVAATGTVTPTNTEQEVQTLPTMTLNGAQITAATAVVQSVADGLLPRDSGLGQLQVLLNLTPQQAEAVMGTVGNGFVPKEKPAPLPFGGQPVKPPADQAEPDEDDPEGDMDQEKMASRNALLAAVRRMVEREALEVRQAGKAPDAFLRTIERLYDRWPAKMHGGIAPFAPGDPTATIAEHCRTAKAAIMELAGECRSADLAERMDLETRHWLDLVPERLTAILMGE